MFWWKPRLIVGAQLERVSWAAKCIGCDLHSWMWWHYKAWCQWMERKYRGRHSKKDDAWVSSWTHEERKWMKDDMVTYSKCPKQRMRKTWTFPLQFFVRECILTRKKKSAVIAWAHTMGQGRWDRIFVWNAIPWKRVQGIGSRYTVDSVNCIDYVVLVIS